MSLAVSVLIPTISFDAYLDEAISSCLPDLEDSDEIVLVVDGPFPERRPRLDSRVSIYALGEHRGTPYALNAGLKVCKNEIVLRLDADDLMIPGRRSLQVAAFERDPELVLLGGAGRLIDSDGITVGHLAYPTSHTQILRELRRRNSFIHSSVAYRRDAVLNIGGYDERCERMQDYELFLRLARHGRIANLSDEVIGYRIHQTMSSKNASPYKRYARQVLKSKWRYSRTQVGFVQSTGDVVAWFGAQLLRFHGLRRPGYLKKGI